METSLITALISAASVMLVAVLTYSLSKRREQDIEWRKLKLEHYQTFMSALSNTIGSRSTSTSKALYADAVNKLQLVAPANVLLALRNLQEAIHHSKSVAVDAHDEAFGELMRAIRADVHSSLTHEQDKLTFRILDVPPQKQ